MTASRTCVLLELFPAPQPQPLKTNVPRAKAKHLHLNWNPVGFLSELSQQKSVTRFPPDVWKVFFCRSFGAPIPKMLAHDHSCTLCSCKMCINPLGDHVLTCKQHTGSTRSHNDLLYILWHPCYVTPRSVLCVSITRCRREALLSMVTLKTLTLLSLSGMVLSLMFPSCKSSRVQSCPWGWDNGVRHSNDVLQARATVKNNKYKIVWLVTRGLHLPW